MRRCTRRMRSPVPFFSSPLLALQVLQLEIDHEVQESVVYHRVVPKVSEVSHRVRRVCVWTAVTPTCV